MADVSTAALAHAHNAVTRGPVPGVVRDLSERRAFVAIEPPMTLAVHRGGRRA